MKIKMTKNEFWNLAVICNKRSAGCSSCVLSGSCQGIDDLITKIEIVEEGADNAEQEADPDERA